MGRPSKIAVEIQSDERGITSVYVGGSSAVIK
jgi:predicted PhzF superfamily epimerase YddE/YHI9